MSQRTKHVNEEIIVELKFKVTINSFSNYNGFKEGQIEQAIQEFKENIQKELEYKVNGEYSQQEFLETVDFVSYEADSQNGLYRFAGLFSADLEAQNIQISINLNRSRNEQ